MNKEKFYLNCIRFDSISNPCPNSKNEYMIIARNLLQCGRYKFTNGDLDRAKEICRNCESFEVYGKGP